MKKNIVIVIAVYSILVNFIGLQPLNDDLVSSDNLFLSPEISQKVNSFEILSNPLYEYYLPRFMKYGPRSRLLENLISGHMNVDIRNFVLSKGEEFPDNVFFIPFLPLLVVLAVFYFLWPEYTKKALF
jgi:hypothetical protein